MNIYIVTGEHYSTPGSPVSAHFYLGAAQTAALDLVNTLRKDFGDQWARENGAPNPLPPEADAIRWDTALMEVQRMQIEGMTGRPMDADDAEDRERLDDWAMCYVRIETLAVSDPPGDTWAPPMRMKVFGLYRGLHDAARALIAARLSPEPHFSEEVLQLALRSAAISSLDHLFS